MHVDPLGLDVRNNSPGTIWVKPEGPGVSIPIPPGGTHTGPQDGVAVPRTRPGEVYKNVDGVDVVVNADGTVEIPGWWDSFLQKLAELAGRAGWKDGSWVDELSKRGDKGWDDLYDKPKSPPDDSKRKPDPKENQQ